jgi:HK97 family phage prohead protease
MTADSLERAFEIVAHRRLAAHEAGHAAAALLLNIPVIELAAPRRDFAALTTEPENPEDAAGHVRHDLPDAALDEPATARAVAIASLAGPLADGKRAPGWPLSLAPVTPDEATLAQLVKQLGLDQDGYQQLLADARGLIESHAYARLHAALAAAAEQHEHLDAAAIHRIHEKTTGPTMQHKRLNVTDVDIGEGELLALASTYETDLVKDRVMPGAYRDTVAKIKAGERLPLIWGHYHAGSPLNWVGEIIDAEETPAGLQIHARFDLDDDAGRKAYALVKRGSIKSLSIGYRVLEKRQAPGGITELLKIELHEVSLVLAPANPGARVLAVKNDDRTDDRPTPEQLRAEGDRIARELGLEDPEMTRVREETRAMIMRAIDATTPPAKRVTDKTHDELRAKAERIAREHAPITIASFPC